MKSESQVIHTPYTTTHTASQRRGNNILILISSQDLVQLLCHGEEKPLIWRCLSSIPSTSCDHQHFMHQNDMRQILYRLKNLSSSMSGSIWVLVRFWVHLKSWSVRSTDSVPHKSFITLLFRVASTFKILNFSKIRITQSRMSLNNFQRNK